MEPSATPPWRVLDAPAAAGNAATNEPDELTVAATVTVPVALLWTVPVLIAQRGVNDAFRSLLT